MGRFSSDLQKLKIVMNEREVGRIITNEQTKNNRMQSRLEGLKMISDLVITYGGENLDKFL